MLQFCCNAMGTVESRCGDRVLNAKRLSRGYIKSLNFLSVAVLVPFLATNVEESMAEERVLDCMLHLSCGSIK